MKVRLTHKYADWIDGIDLTDRRVGEIIDMPESEARLLVLEQWALPEPREEYASEFPRRRRGD